MKHTLIFFLLITSLGCAQQKDTRTDKEIALELCEEFSKQYSKNNSYQSNRMIYIKTVQIKLVNYDSEKEENISRKLHELCPSFLEYSTVASKLKAESKGRPDAFKLWDIYIKSQNDIPWTESEKKQFLDICNYALSKRPNSEKLCECTIDKVSERLSAEYFLGLSTNEQGYLGGQVGYVYCSE
ncbi:hypothetical protein H7U19_08940 [Hyunsoonleella sp. SJ7]|uniref:Lipoprotein n=1 Tax=Hyunsoonleella aquatilis TaxID=2762758 RepID=A0A923KKI1_9FLAO|nr:hypothetical protein [Hyunsoonleella aquatilis]MBC3758527.1 hypothetical protein [Hyunsoonleella aquatilis]